MSDSPTSSPQDAARRVLLVDDHEDASAMLADLLRIHGHVVDVAADGPAALARVAEQPPDVALIDIGLPGMTGYELAAALRQTPAGAAMRLVALSGFASRGQDNSAAFDAYLLKPTSVRDILAVLTLNSPDYPAAR